MAGEVSPALIAPPRFWMRPPLTGMSPRYATLAGKWQHRHLSINMRSYSWPYGRLWAQQMNLSVAALTTCEQAVRSRWIVGVRGLT